ncbi:hypothetical protein HELRODRAFT_62918, partial [Helobdella robusta]|uniref:C-type lectin domain-containing protein n=1 Tax=Helobdella robusta TaxID=6412 RepID=T1FX76_HELRO
CPNGFSGVGGRCITVVDRQMNWDDAANECIKLGASLAIVDTPAVIQGLSDFLGNNYKGFDAFNWKIFRASMFLDEICAFRNVTEAKNWAPGEPNNLGDEGCVEFRRYGEKFMFNDLSCSLKNCLLCQLL